MARTDIDLDGRLVAEVMRRYDLGTKKAAVNFALQRLVGPVMTREAMLALEGSGWDGDLAELRTGPVRPV